jgi:glycosyltransferase involved in cell wall biosynthesis
LVLGLRPYGIQSTVYTGSAGKNETEGVHILRQAGVTVITLDGFGMGSNPADDPKACWKFYRHATHADLWHTHTAKAGMYGRSLASLFGKPCLHSYHGHVLRGYFSPRIQKIIHRTEQLLAAGGAHAHALTSGQTEELRDQAKIGRRRWWHTIGLPITPIQLPASTAPPASHPVVAWLGRLAPVKDPFLAIEVLRTLRTLHPQAELLLAGHGALAEQLPRHEPGLKILGHQPAGNVLAPSNMMLMTSHNEGLPLAAIEAAHAGRPIIAPAVGGLRDLQRQGIVQATQRTPKALAERLYQCWQDSWQQQGMLAQKAAQCYLPNRILPQYAACYKTILKRFHE